MEPKARLRYAAKLSLCVHLIAGLAMLFILRRGLETNPVLDDRLAFLARHGHLWRCAWASWNLAAVSIGYLFFALWRVHPGRAAKSALYIVCAAMVFDLSAEYIEMNVLPHLALLSLLGEPGARELFFLQHRAAVLLTGCAANGLYTTGLWLIVVSTWREYPFWVRGAGLGAGLAGIAATGAAVSGDPAYLLWTNALLVPCLLAWQAGLAYSHMEPR